MQILHYVCGKFANINKNSFKVYEVYCLVCHFYSMALFHCIKDNKHLKLLFVSLFINIG